MNLHIINNNIIIIINQEITITIITDNLLIPRAKHHFFIQYQFISD